MTAMQICAVALVLFNVLCTLPVLLSRSYERRQKVAQSIFIWILPLLGGLIALLMWLPTRRSR